MSRTTIALTLLALLAVPASATATPADLTAVGTETYAHRTNKTLRFTETVRSGAKVIGHDSVLCSLGSTTRCRGVFTFKDGTLKVSGAIDLSRKANRVAIVGGTGAYAAAAGTLALKTLTSHKTQETFRFR